MTKSRLISQTLVKRTAAAAIAAAKARNNWSDHEAGDALGVCRTTILNRLDGDDPGKQMTLFELLRSIQSDGSAIANDILSLVDHKAVPHEASDRTSDRSKASSICRAQLAVSVMLEDEAISDQEIRDHREALVQARDDIDALLRRIAPKAVQG